VPTPEQGTSKPGRVRDLWVTVEELLAELAELETGT
jgi:hypothetical protein